MYLIICSAKHLPSYVLFNSEFETSIFESRCPVNWNCIEFLTKKTNAANVVFNFKLLTHHLRRISQSFNQVMCRAPILSVQWVVWLLIHSGHHLQRAAYLWGASTVSGSRRYLCGPEGENREARGDTALERGLGRCGGEGVVGSHFDHWLLCDVECCPCLLRDGAKEPGGERLLASRAHLSKHGVSVNRGRAGWTESG